MPLSLEDTLAIQSLYAVYSAAFDTGDPRTFAETFAEDCEFLTEHGRGAALAYVEKRLRERPDDPHSDTVHVLTNMVLDYASDHDHARGLVYLLGIGRNRTTGQRELLQDWPVCYLDDFVRLEGRWYFKRRTPLWELPDSSSVPWP